MQPEARDIASRQRHASQAAAVAARGKKAKSKKAAEKYAGQDEEDRQLAMAILGSAGKQRGNIEQGPFPPRTLSNIVYQAAGVLPELSPMHAREI